MERLKIAFDDVHHPQGYGLWIPRSRLVFKIIEGVADKVFKNHKELFEELNKSF